MNGQRFYTLSDVVNTMIQRALDEVHTACPAVIESYDSTKVMATVKPCLRRKYSDGEIIPLPTIHNVPVIFPRTQKAAITFPLEKGDNVLLVFADRSLDEWLSNGGEITPEHARKFDLSDAIAIPGFFPFGSGSLPTNGTDFSVQFKDQSITIKPNGNIEVGADALQALVTEAYKSALETFFASLQTAIGTGITSVGGTYTPVVFTPPVNSLTSKVKAE